jgi:hypothetical protein
MSDKFQSELDSIVADAQAKISKVSAAYVASKLTNGSAPAATFAEPSPGRRRSAGKSRKPAKRPAAKAKAKASRAPGVKRDPAVIESIKERFLAHVQANPGQGIEEIKRALKMETKELTLPVKQLLADKKIATKGEKRSTKYYPRG